MRIVVDLASYPKNPPKKWSGFNAVQVCLNLIGVRDLEITGGGVSMIGELFVKTVDDKSVVFDLLGNHGVLHLKGRADAMRIDSVKGYFDEVR